MNNGSMATPPRSNSILSLNSGPSIPSPLGRRSSTLPSPGFLSPMNLNAGTPSVYQNSIAAPSQFGGSTSRRFSTYSPSASNAGSTISTPNKFKRGHIRKKAPVLIPTVNPDDLDLNTLTDPDDLFRLFGVREVRGLEKRAKDAAAMKVSDLRTMVGERYRDLLSAADSIVRMRVSAEKLVERLEKVEAGVGVSGGTTPSKRGFKQLAIRRNSSPEPDRTLQSPATLSLTIQLFLSLPSLVHTLLESSSFLPAARLEGVGRVVYRELSTFPFGIDEEVGALKQSFPIIERQWESVGSLGSVITRRATLELKSWTTSSVTTAETLAAILMLDNASLPSTLSLLLEARSKSLTSILNSTTKSKDSHDIKEVLLKLSEVLAIVLRTVEVANDIFTPSNLYPEGILSQLLKQIENPNPVASTSTSTSSPLHLSPTLSSLPDYPLLLRHLSPSILDFTPFLSISSPRNVLSPAAAETQINDWLTKESARVVIGVNSWISDLKGGAKTLAKVRTAVRSGFTNSTSTSSSGLLSQLETVIESRLEAVYQNHLSTLVQRVSPCLQTLLISLPNSKSDINPNYFLFEESLSFPPPAHYLLPSRVIQNGLDPFEIFLDKILKRVEGFSPLIELGLNELELHAKDLREDLEDWLGGGIGIGIDEIEIGAKLRMKNQYVQSAKDTFDGVYQALLKVLNEVTTDVTSALFLGQFIFKLSQSKTFTRDLLLGSAPILKSREGLITSEWESRLQDLQSRSLNQWRIEAINTATKSIQDAIKLISISPSTFTNWTWDASKVNSNENEIPIPTSPSSFILIALKSLIDSIRKIGPTRLESNEEIIINLMKEFQFKVLELIDELLLTISNLLEEKEKKDVALQSLWDINFLRRFLSIEKEEEWKVLEDRLEEIINIDKPTLIRLQQSTLHYLQRTQTILYPLLSPLQTTNLLESTTTTTSTELSKMLPWGNPPSGYEFKNSVGVVIPKARLGLLRE